MAPSSDAERNIPLNPGADNRWETLQVKTDADGLAPAVIQDINSGQVLMLGYLNAAAWQKTLELGLITFFSRSKNRLWTKGESSGNTLQLFEAALDCDRDTFLLKVKPTGAVCHSGSHTCWGAEELTAGGSFLNTLENIIQQRKSAEAANSYTASLFAAGVPKIAQKVGEEAVETVIEALGNDRERLLNESADLLFHLLVLLAAKEVRLAEVEGILKNRHRTG